MGKIVLRHDCRLSARVRASTARLIDVLSCRGPGDLVGVDPLPSRVWYQDMADFADRISDVTAGRRLARDLQGRGAFRRFKNELHEEYPHLLPAWHAFRDVRARRRTVGWLIDNALGDNETGERFVAEYPDLDLA